MSISVCVFHRISEADKSNKQCMELQNRLNDLLLQQKQKDAVCMHSLHKIFDKFSHT